MSLFPPLTLRESPFAHAESPDFLPPALYDALRASFPTCPPLGGPSGYSFFRGDPEYDALVAQNPAWATLVGALQSQDFVGYGLAQFPETFRSEGCAIDPRRAHYVDHYESRADKKKRHMDPVALAPDDVWVRVDILQGRLGYGKPAHLDHRRRLMAMLIYFCDADEIGMEGGDLVLHGLAGGAPGPAVKTFAPRHNLMVAFPCSPTSFHSVSPIARQTSPRNFVQVAISSPVDAWPA